MIRRVSLAWPGDDPGQAAAANQLRLLAVSDENVRAFDFDENREAIAPVDAVIGAGDLEPDYLDFLANAFNAPLLYVRGNHDRGANWQVTSECLPQPLDIRPERIGDVTVAGLSWPGEIEGRAARDDRAAWGQALRFFARHRLKAPVVIVSHVPPLGLGDSSDDTYHRGFAAYHWLCRRIKPVVWLHGHTNLAAAQGWRTSLDNTTLINVTGAVLLELGSAAVPAAAAANIAPRE